MTRIERADDRVHIDFYAKVEYVSDLYDNEAVFFTDDGVSVKIELDTTFDKWSGLTRIERPWRPGDIVKDSDSRTLVCQPNTLTGSDSTLLVWRVVHDPFDTGVLGRVIALDGAKRPLVPLHLESD